MYKKGLDWWGIGMFITIGFVGGVLWVEWYADTPIENIRQAIDICRGTR